MLKCAKFVEIRCELKNNKKSTMKMGLILVQSMRLELTRISPLASETNAYANSATTADKTLGKIPRVILS